MSTVVVVAGALANKPHNGGGVWERLSWVVGLRRLGFESFFIEQATPAADVDWFLEEIAAAGLADMATLIAADGKTTVGLPWDDLLDLTSSADLLINLSGNLTLDSLLRRIRRKAYVDVDPGFTQFWHTDPNTSFELLPHDTYFTIGANVGRPGCPVPTCGIDWRHTRQPVVMDDWPDAQPIEPGRFTTVASWRGPFGPIIHNGRTLGLKVHEFRRFSELPQRLPFEFEIALDIQPADAADRAALVANGWQLVDPLNVAGSGGRFREYVQQSPAEFSVAQGVYVATQCGWFSDRTVRYLASGSPALVQNTGFDNWLPEGEGVVAFRTPDEAAAGAERIVADYARHAKAARRLARDYFDSDKVIARFLQDAL